MASRLPSIGYSEGQRDGSTRTRQLAAVQSTAAVEAMHFGVLLQYRAGIQGEEKLIADMLPFILARGELLPRILPSVLARHIMQTVSSSCQHFLRG